MPAAGHRSRAGFSYGKNVAHSAGKQRQARHKDTAPRGPYSAGEAERALLKCFPQPLDNTRLPIEAGDVGLTRSREVAKGDS